MAVNLLLGAVTAIILLNDQYAQNSFVWGAGDLGQNAREQVLWLMPKLLPIFAIFLLAPRVLTLLSIGNEGAAARGLWYWHDLSCVNGTWRHYFRVDYLGRCDQFYWIDCAKHRETFGFKGEIWTHRKLRVRCTVALCDRQLGDFLGAMVFWIWFQQERQPRWLVLQLWSWLLVSKCLPKIKCFSRCLKRPRSISPLAYFLLGAMILVCWR